MVQSNLVPSSFNCRLTLLKYQKTLYSMAESSPAVSYMLNPAKNQICDSSNPQISNWEYKGKVNKFIRKHCLFWNDMENYSLFLSNAQKSNEYQLNVVRSICAQYVSQASAVSLIQCPPGTGKTRLIADLLLHLFSSEKKPENVLVCAHSNKAVDNLALECLDIVK